MRTELEKKSTLGRASGKDLQGFPEERSLLEQDPLVQEMNELLANEYLLFTKTLNYHWNMVGPRFYSLHVFLEGQYKQLLEMTDEVAERIRFLEGRPVSTLKEMKMEGSLPEEPGHFPASRQMLAELYEAHRDIDRQIAEILQTEGAGRPDPVTEDVLIGLLRRHQKMMWMLGSHLESDEDASEQIN